MRDLQFSPLTDFLLGMLLSPRIAHELSPHPPTYPLTMNINELCHILSENCEESSIFILCKEVLGSKPPIIISVPHIDDKMEISLSST